nr:glycosyltransferase family 39 protein [Ectothiorhodospira lacustris]
MWLGSVITIGIILRLLWVISFPASPSSDGATYLWLAEKLSRGEEYGGTGWRAFWPPGYPFLLSPIVAIFGSSKEVIVGTNLAIYTGTIIGVYFLGRTIGGEACGRIATAIICIWPTHIALTGVPEKEMPLILILVIVFLLLYRRPKNYKIALPAGMILGFGALVQPSVILLTTAVIVSDFLIRSPAKIILMRLALILLGMALIISPWSIRNYQVFDQFVLISTNGGGVFYKANHPEATGGFIRTQWTDQLDQYPELEANALGFKLGMEWIRENPMDFLRLAIEKQILFLGDDSTGIYETLRRGGIQVSEPTYAAWKAVANSYWILIWIIILVGTYRWLSRREPPSILLLPMILVFLYFYSIHSIVESGGKYHLPALGFLAIIAALSITEKQRSHRQSQQRP